MDYLRGRHASSTLTQGTALKIIATLALALSIGLYGAASQSPAPDGIAKFRAGAYREAIPLLEQSQTANPQDPIAGSDLLSALVYEGRVDEAVSLGSSLSTTFPDSPDALAAEGDLAFYLGDVAKAERLYFAALQKREATARAYFGLYRLYRSASMHKRARRSLIRAYAIDPANAAIEHAWISILTPEKRKEFIQDFLKAHPGADVSKDLENSLSNGSEMAKALQGRQPDFLQGEHTPTSIHLEDLRFGPNNKRGYGLLVRINGKRPLKLLLDTGASGILINERAADRAGLTHLGRFETWGFGDNGVRHAFASVADTCQIGSLTYKNCILTALESSKSITDEDGLIGTDFFSAFLIQLDFQRNAMNLTPQPERPVDPQGYDRVVPPGFTPAFRFGHHLLVGTKLNGATKGLFLIDTGSSQSGVDREFALESTKVYGNEYVRLKGISGRVKDVFEANKAVIEFAGYRQDNLGMMVWDLNNSGKHQEVRLAGVLGMPVLDLFRPTLDYRNGVVKFDYNKNQLY